MTGRLAITETDLRALLAVTEDEDDHLVTLMPVATLACLRDLVGADEVSFYRVDPWRSRQQVNVSSVPAEEDDSVRGDDPGGWSERHWELFWVFEAATHPWQGREFGPVKTLSEFNSHNEIDRHHLGEVLRAAGVRWVLSVPLARSGPWCDGLVVYRCSGLDFTDRDRLLFMLLRPHLQNRVRAAEAAGRSRSLTARQRQLLGLVAEGLTNAQTAHQLGLSPDTVRKHLENIYAVLGVRSRTAAVAAVFGPDLRA